ncbi:MAG: DUF3820 family protein [Saprospiraceae bacterium]
MLPDPKILLQLVKMRMPFGKYEGRLLCDLPVSYLEWFNNRGFPKGKLGMLLETMFVIKSNGLDDLLKPLRSGRFPEKGQEQKFKK